jgi:hypothetical protein
MNIKTSISATKTLPIVLFLKNKDATVKAIVLKITIAQENIRAITFPSFSQFVLYVKITDKTITLAETATSNIPAIDSFLNFI